MPTRLHALPSATTDPMLDLGLDPAYGRDFARPRGSTPATDLPITTTQRDLPAVVELRNPYMSGFTHESSVNESVEWYTPPEIFEALGLTFDLDPCSPGPGKSYVPTLKHYTIHDDGLTSPWSGTAWVNPPYGPHTKVWMEKLAKHGDGIALVFARTDVKWFQEHGVKADMICFVNSRIRFFQGDITKRGGTPGAGSMLLAYGKKAAAALQQSGLGACFTLVPGTAVEIPADPQLDLFADLAETA